jgi:L-2-hydroxyglutarate oxidase
MGPTDQAWDYAIAGGGIVGLATALALSRRGHRVVVLEAEAKIAAHQTGHNSGVIHSGLYYTPGSLKARLCVEGREQLYAFCAEHHLPVRRCGKIVVACDAAEEDRLAELCRRGTANGLRGLRRMSREEVREREPHVWCRSGLLVPQTGVVDFVEVAQAMARVLTGAGGQLRTMTRVHRVLREPSGLLVETSQGTYRARRLINCAGLDADRLARRCGARPRLRIVPFRGAYYAVVAARGYLVRGLVYPVPDPRLPFLGVHLTRRIGGQVEVGPSAVPALKRTGYRPGGVSLRDSWEMLTDPGVWRLAGRYWRTGLQEMYRACSKVAFARAVRRMVPELQAGDLVPAPAGVRAQALGPGGCLVDDFAIVAQDRILHVLNAPSPAATASLAIGERIAAQAAGDEPYPAKRAE